MTVCLTLTIRKGQSALFSRLRRTGISQYSDAFVFAACAIPIAYCIAILLSSTSLFFRVPLSNLQPLLALGITLFLIRIADIRNDYFLKAVMILVVVFCIVLVVNSLIWDTSYDGQVYHSDAILTMSRGWNFILTAVPEDADSPNLIQFYSKGAWVVALALWRLTGNFESAKGLHMMLGFASVILAWKAIVIFTGISNRRIVIIACLIGLNPILLSQMFSFYVDGQVGAAFTCAICAFLIFTRYRHWLWMLVMIASLIVLANLKLTGLLYAIMLAGGFMLWLLVERNWKRWYLIVFFILAFPLGIMIAGYNPYILPLTTNILQGQTPFYPTTLSDLSHIETQMPANFVAIPPLERFATSLFSRVQSNFDTTIWKLPFFVTGDELIALGNVDARSGGFGALFSGILIVVAAYSLNFFIRQKQVWQTEHKLMTALITLITVTIVVNPEAWWARFVPQLWLVPLLCLVLVLRVDPKQLHKRLLNVILIMLVINQLMIGGPRLITAIGGSVLQRAQLSELAERVFPVEIDFQTFSAIRFRFEWLHIDYHEGLTCDKKDQAVIISTEVLVCL